MNEPLHLLQETPSAFFAAYKAFTSYNLVWPWLISASNGVMMGLSRSSYLCDGASTSFRVTSYLSRWITTVIFTELFLQVSYFCWFIQACHNRFLVGFFRFIVLSILWNRRDYRQNFQQNYELGLSCVSRRQIEFWFNVCRHLDPWIESTTLSRNVGH